MTTTDKEPTITITGSGLRYTFNTVPPIRPSATLSVEDEKTHSLRYNLDDVQGIDEIIRIGRYTLEIGIGRLFEGQASEILGQILRVIEKQWNWSSVIEMTVVDHTGLLKH